ncbi:MAG: hypothetical protein HY746_05515 [Elusimicrobia bacterium]|nr:hypothetical protein [Elusimicrobiota bacterium]
MNFPVSAFLIFLSEILMFLNTSPSSRFFLAVYCSGFLGSPVDARPFLRAFPLPQRKSAHFTPGRKDKV